MTLRFLLLLTEGRSMPFIVVTQLLLMKNALKEGNQRAWQEQETG
jgi:hypothetical protein